MEKQKSIKHNIAIFFVGLSVALTTLIVLVAVSIFIPEIRHVEEKKMDKTLHQATAILDHEFKRLGTVANDWAYWDDTYRYVYGDAPNYEQSNLNSETLRITEFALVNITTLDGEIVSGRYLDPENSINDYTGAPTFDGVWPEWLKRELKQSPKGLDGYMPTHLGTLLIVARPILTSQKEGPSRGWVIIGRWLNKKFTQEFSSQLHQPVLFAPVDMKEYESFGKEVHTGIGYYIQRLSFTEIRARALYRDYKGDPIFSLTLDEQRVEFIEALKALGAAILGFLVTCLLCSWVAYRQVKRKVLIPLSELAKSMEQLGNQSMPLPESHSFSSNEISLLYSKYREMANRLLKSQQALKEQSSYLEKEALTDPLTNLHNRRYLDRLMIRNRSKDMNAPNVKKALFVIDVDDFKKLNDKYGHVIGDNILIQLANILRAIVQEGDHVVRMGGEEFLIVATFHSEEHSQALADRIKQRVEKFPFEVDLATPLSITVSIGFAFYPLCQSSTHNDNWEPWEPSLSLADYCLFEAKDAGRNAWVGCYAESSFSNSQLSMIPREIGKLVALKALRQVTNKAA